MSNTVKLSAGQKHLLRLAFEGIEADGWAPVSAQVYPLMEKMPNDLVVLERVGDEGWGRMRLTPLGNNIIDAFPWLVD